MLNLIPNPNLNPILPLPLPIPHFLKTQTSYNPQLINLNPNLSLTQTQTPIRTLTRILHRRALYTGQIDTPTLTLVLSLGSTLALTLARTLHTREERVHRFALISRPIKTHVILKLLLSTNQIFRQENPYALLL